MTAGTTLDAGAAGPAGRVPAAWWPVVAVVSAAAAAAAVLLPWWRPAAGPVLLGSGPIRDLPPDAWTGTEVAGPRAAMVAVLAVAAVVAALAGARRGGTTAVPGRRPAQVAAAAGGSAVACAGITLAGWGPTTAPGTWTALAAGLAAVGAALLSGAGSARVVVTAAVLAAAGTLVVPDGQVVRDQRSAGPFVRVASVGPFPLRSGAVGLAGALDDARPVVADGSPGIVTGAGLVVADPWGRARVLARTDRGAPAPLGVAGDRLARWAGPDIVAVTGLRAGGPLEVVVRDVVAASRMGSGGTLWLRSDLDPPETVRRLDVGAWDGEQVLSATYLPVVTIQNPPGEGPIDVGAVLPVPGGALRVADVAGVPRLQRLTETASGVAVAPVAGTAPPPCGLSSPVPPTGGLRTVAPDGSGVWFPAAGPDGDRLVHLALDGTWGVVAAPPPGAVVALTAPGDGSLLLTARGDRGDALWRLSGARPPEASPAC